MARLRRILFGTATGLSVVLCVVIVILWWQSRSALAEIHFRGWTQHPIAATPTGSAVGEPLWTYTRGTYHCIGSYHGRVYYARGGERPGFDPFLDAAMEGPIDFSPALEGGVLDFGHAAPVGAILQPCSVWFVPHWFLLLLTAILPMRVWLVMDRKEYDNNWKNDIENG